MMMIIVLLIEFIYMLRMQMEQNINIFLIKVKNDLENLKNPKIVTEYSNNIQDVYKNIEEFNPDKKRNVVIISDAMVAYIISKT